MKNELSTIAKLVDMLETERKMILEQAEECFNLSCQRSQLTHDIEELRKELEAFKKVRISPITDQEIQWSKNAFANSKGGLNSSWRDALEVFARNRQLLSP